MKFDTDPRLHALRAAMRSYNAKYAPCSACLAVGCLPEHFGAGNPDAQPCPACAGRGAVPRQHSLTL